MLSSGTNSTESSGNLASLGVASPCVGDETIETIEVAVPSLTPVAMAEKVVTFDSEMPEVHSCANSLSKNPLEKKHAMKGSDVFQRL